jgi:hypothetical protein
MSASSAPLNIGFTITARSAGASVGGAKERLPRPCLCGVLTKICAQIKQLNRFAY